MAEWGIDLSREFPKPMTDEVVRAADAVITMGCGDACPIYPGKRYEDWDLDDPAGKRSSRCGRSATSWTSGCRRCWPSWCPPSPDSWPPPQGISRTITRWTWIDFSSWRR